MSLINPIWLWAFGGLAIPVAIHLLSRKEGKTIRLGSIRFLTETSTSKFSSIRLNEVVLLAIRSLLIAVLVVFLAGLILPPSDPDSEKSWLLVEHGLEKDEHIKTLIDSLQQKKYEVRWLEKDFQAFDSHIDSSNNIDYYKLIESLPVRQRTIKVLATNRLSGFKGKRIALPENVTWISYPVRNPAETPKTTFEKDSLKITVAFDKHFRYDKTIMLAALRAIQSIAPSHLVISETEVSNFKGSPDWLIWLSETIPVHSGKTLKFSQQVSQDLITQKSSSTWFLTQHLDDVNAVEQHLPIQLTHMLFGKTFDHQAIQIPNDLAFSKKPKSPTNYAASARMPADKILLMIIVMLFISERIFAFYRKQ